MRLTRRRKNTFHQPFGDDVEKANDCGRAGCGRPSDETDRPLLFVFSVCAARVARPGQRITQRAPTTCSRGVSAGETAPARKKRGFRARHFIVRYLSINRAAGKSGRGGRKERARGIIDWPLADAADADATAAAAAALYIYIYREEVARRLSSGALSNLDQYHL